MSAPSWLGRLAEARSLDAFLVRWALTMLAFVLLVTAGWALWEAL